MSQHAAPVGVGSPSDDCNRTRTMNDWIYDAMAMGVVKGYWMGIPWFVEVPFMVSVKVMRGIFYCRKA